MEDESKREEEDTGIADAERSSMCKNWVGAVGERAGGATVIKQALTWERNTLVRSINSSSFIV